MSSLPTGRTYKGMPVPFFFQEKTSDFFKAMDVKENDVFMSSLPKGGTTWCHTILWLLLHGMDKDGNMAVTNDGKVPIGSNGQVYPEALDVHRYSSDELLAPDDMRRKFFGTWGFADDLCGQDSPRLFSTHLHGKKWLPTQLFGNDGRGRVVLVLRNLKDVMCSLHFFRGEAKDGWLGNDLGAGSFYRFIDPNTPNAYGSTFDMIKAMDELVELLPDRVHVVYFEKLKQALPSEVKRLAKFLKVDCSDTKLNALCEAVGFSNMKSAKTRSSTGGINMGTMMLRKGAIGDWTNHLTPQLWEVFDKMFDTKLGSVAIAQPMLHFMYEKIPGLPPQLSKQTIMDDPRLYENFKRVVLKDGMIIRDQLIAKSRDGKGFLRPMSEFCGVVEKNGSGAKFEAEEGRYHLFAAGTCPWASGCMAVRQVLGLAGIISADWACGQSGAGWVFQAGTACSSFLGREGPFYGYEIYQAADPQISTRITMPILWDKKLKTIVSNDSWSIVKMLSTVFAPLGSPAAPITLFGDGSAKSIVEVDLFRNEVYPNFLNGVYKCGIGLLKGVPDSVIAAARSDVYNMLDRLEKILSKQRYLLGNKITAIDIQTLMTIVRWDVSYQHGFGLGNGKGSGGIILGDGYPNLCNFSREIYALIETKNSEGGVVLWQCLRQYYRWAIGHPAKLHLPPIEPIIKSIESNHNRATLFSI